MKPFEIQHIANHDEWHRTLMACIHERWVVFVTRAQWVDLDGVAINKDTFTLNIWDPRKLDPEYEITDSKDFSHYCEQEAGEGELVARELYYSKSDLMARISELYVGLDRDTP